MKNKTLKLLATSLFAFGLASCAGSTEASLGSEGDIGKGDGYVDARDEDAGIISSEMIFGGRTTATTATAASGGVMFMPGGSEGEKSGEGQEVKPEPGQLTCSALDDHKEYDYWCSLSETSQDKDGVFKNYVKRSKFNTFNRIDLTVLNANNITVTLADQSYSAHVDNLHKAYLFPQTNEEYYDVTISYDDAEGVRQTVNKTVTHQETIDLENENVKTEKMQLMFVIDTTGSMMDELTYIKSEVEDVIGQIKNDNANIDVSLAMMVYRDKGDEYITNYNDFTNDINAQKAYISAQKSTGGGDFPEAVATALDEALSKNWNDDDTTKIIVHVADAPSHDYEMEDWNEAVIKAASKGIKIITVASSGIDRFTEYCFRSQSLLTAGQYVYLTNHSGIGGSHLEATVKEPLVVEYLNACLVRLVDGYYNGTFADPVPYATSEQPQEPQESTPIEESSN